ncbi:helix-turn-helix domain-containing protein [Nonomuraea sp. NPDC050790]|uniref:helix-turn-helix domain-containing protein n=1 Tax=Nonomuraea sp. NPDC050790 TaxID=3364371 RepID=UPI0037AFB9F9
MTAPDFLRLAEARRADLDMTKLALTEKAGIGRVTYDRLSNPATRPQMATIVRIADALGIDRQEAVRTAGLLNPSTPVELAEQRAHAAIAEVLQRRLSDVEPDVLARVALEMGEIMQAVASQLFQQAKPKP